MLGGACGSVLGRVMERWKRSCLFSSAYHCDLIKELDATVEGDVDTNDPGTRNSHLPSWLETTAC